MNNRIIDPNVITSETKTELNKNECKDIGPVILMKICPSCGKNQIYKNLVSFRRSLLLEKKCKKCIQSNHKTQIPKNGWARKCPDCGNPIQYRSKGALTLGTKTNRCCYECQATQRTKIMPNSYFRITRHSAETRKLKFEISKLDMQNLFIEQNGKCAFTGDVLTFSIRRLHGDIEGTASLDRIDSTKGYIKGNIQWVHKDINKMKGNLSQSKFLELCNKISSHNK